MYFKKYLSGILSLVLILAVLFSFKCDVSAAEALHFVDKVKTVTAGDTIKVKVNKPDATYSLSSAKAVIEEDGTLTAVRYGKVRVFATVDDKTISYVLKIKPKAVIGIDPGHQQQGNYSTEPVGPGASDKKTAVAGGTSGVSTGKPEYMLTMEVAKKLKKELVLRGYKVVMTRSKNDVNITNMERALLLNEECDIAIRLHADGSTSSDANGASALYPSASNPYVGQLSDMSRNLSECVLDSYCEATGLKSRGLVIRDDLTGTNWSTIPVTLLEMGFMTNASDDEYMSSIAGMNQMVKGIADGIDLYL